MHKYFFIYCLDNGVHINEIDNDFGKEKDDMTVIAYKIHKKESALK